VNPVIGLDIDGTLGDYHPHFIGFANGWLGTEHDTLGYDARLPLNRYLGVSKERYRKIKLAYRRGEMKRSMPDLPLPYPQVRALTVRLREWGYDVWLCTTRPYLNHDSIEPATREWCRRNGARHQGIVWGEHKYRELCKLVGKERVLGVLDDLPEMCRQAHSLGIPTAFAVRRHNIQQHQALGIERFNWNALETHEDTLEWAKALLVRWKAAQ